MQVRLIVNINDFNNVNRGVKISSELRESGLAGDFKPSTFSTVFQSLTSPPSRAKSAKSVEILKLDVIANDWICPATPSKGKKNKFQCDRFIPVRETMGEPSEQLKIPQRESGKEQYLNSNELEYQEKLAEACGVSLEKRILAFNLQPPSSQKDDLHWSIKNMVAIGLDQCVYIWNADTGGVTSLERTNPSD
ncbi:sleepy Slp1 [Rhizophagus irregularis DAOM 181602=DAOM 197198]|nr:sleepy Slp1 [Rhizophagus irregularis DAOM 181602=DAOM 197198]